MVTVGLLAVLADLNCAEVHRRWGVVQAPQASCGSVEP
jgi:hypothetical protein